MTTRSVLVTGGYGFLGRAVGKCFHNAGYEVHGVGHGRWDRDESARHGFARWLDAGVSMGSLMTFGRTFDVIAHCAGNGSVGYAQTNPRQDFAKTVESTIEVLEFVRMQSPEARLVYPSSAGVYGAKGDAPIRETDPLNPISVYGFNKRMVEQLCEVYSRSYGVQVGIVRFFSIYGAGLTKQLLWDASARLCGSGAAEFFGTGEETRDWIHVSDAAHLMLLMAERRAQYDVVNGAGGDRMTVRAVLERLRDAHGRQTSIAFNGMERPGDPRFYHADVDRLRALGFTRRVSLDEGLREYARWFGGVWSP